MVIDLLSIYRLLFLRPAVSYIAGVDPQFSITSVPRPTGELVCTLRRINRTVSVPHIFSALRGYSLQALFPKRFSGLADLAPLCAVVSPWRCPYALAKSAQREDQLILKQL
jgi:hypothetical protein